MPDDAGRWVPDELLDGFQQRTIPLPAQTDGELVATLVRKCTPEMSGRAVLYVHGFVDYFFQAHVADAFIAQGWDFYAIDLHRYGRSLREGNRPNYASDLSEYNRELGIAIDIIRNHEDHDTLLLVGHSMGGLVTALYAHDGEKRGDIDGVVLNSPFFDFFLPPHRKIQLPAGSFLGRIFPFLSDRKAISPRYLESISSAYSGEWEIDERYKPLAGFPAYYGWINAIRRAQARLLKGLDIKVPVLVLHGSASMFPAGSNDERHFSHDIVLDVAHMRERAHRLGKQVTIKRIEGGVHDIFLSREPVRARAFTDLFRWTANALGARKVDVRTFRT